MTENAQQLLQERTTRFNTAVKLGQPDRVPFAPNLGGMPFEWFGVTYAEAFKDPGRAAYAWLEFLKAYPRIDVRAGFWAAIPFSARTKELLGYKLLNFPGVDIEDENVGFQFIEEEYMKATDYDAFLHNPGDFGLRRLLPQFADAFKSLALLPNLDGAARGYGTVGEWCIAFTKDELWKSFEAFREAGKEHLKTVGVIRKFNEDALALGLPGMVQGTVTAPFDVVSDLLRGTVGAMKDMFRNGEKLLKLIDWAEAYQAGVLRGLKANGATRVFFPLHKGIDPFMNDAQFRKFYWPSLDRLHKLCASMDITCIDVLQHAWDSRLEIIADTAPGHIVYSCEQTDVVKAKKVMGKTACILGGMPLSTLLVGSPDEIRDQVKRVMQEAAPGGGFMMGVGGSIINCSRANFDVFYEAVEQYGNY